MLSQTAEHALRALLFLAQQPNGPPVPVEVIAGAIEAPRNYLSKTLHALTKHGIVSGTRGPRGGFRLSVPPAELALARVIEAFDEPRHRSMCMLGGRPCTDQAPCAVHERWKALWEASLAPLRSTTLADLLTGHRQLDRLGVGVVAALPARD